MSLMTENLLLQAQSLRLDGDIDTSIDLLRVVVKQCNADLQEKDEKRSTDDVIGNSSKGEESNSIIVLQLRETAAYQLALLLLQRSGRRCNSTSNDNDHTIQKKKNDVDETETDNILSDIDEIEADNILSKLGYRLRISKLAFGYPICNCNRQQKRYNNTQPTASSLISAIVIDDILPLSIFNALQHAYRPESKYWSELYSKVNSTTTAEKQKNTNQFASHNIPLPTNTPPSSILEQVAILVQQQLQDDFPYITHATSVEVWSHQRPPDGEHQLHYDMDEIRLWKHRKGSINQGENRSKRQKTNPKSNDGISCPIVSCVLTVNIPNEEQLGTCSVCGKTGNSNPTIICNQSILDMDRTHSSNVGCLCYPYPNRLLAFEGSLLHGVIPGIPQESSATSDNDESSCSEDSYNMQDTSHSMPVSDDDNQRVTLMLGFWKDVPLTDNNSAVIGPNVPFDGVSCSWKEEFNPVDMKERDFNHRGTKNTQLLNSIDPLWVRIDEEDFGKYTAADSAKQCGRFFLESTDYREIDTKVLSGI